MVDAACTSGETTEGLAAAWIGLDRDHRRLLVEAIVSDADAEGVSAASVLAALLSVEDDAEVARALADALRRAAARETLRPAERTRALFAGTEEAGTVVVVRPLHGEFVEVLGVAWEEQGITSALFEPYVHRGELDEVVRRIADIERLTDAAVPFVMDRLAPVVWRQRREGKPLPAGLDRFADLFSSSG